MRIGKYVNHRIRVRGDESPLENQAGRVIDAANVGSPEATVGQSVRSLDEPVSLRPTATTVRRAQFNETLPPPVSGDFAHPGPGTSGSLSPVPTETMGGPMMGEPGPGRIGRSRIELCRPWTGAIGAMGRTGHPRRRPRLLELRRLRKARLRRLQWL